MWMLPSSVRIYVAAEPMDLASSSSTNRSSEVTAVPLPRPLPIPGSHRALTFIQNRRP